MTTSPKTNQLSITRYSEQWTLYQRIGQFAKALDILPDADRALKNKNKSAPTALLKEVF